MAEGKLPLLFQTNANWFQKAAKLCQFLRSNSRTIVVLDTGESSEILSQFYSKPNYEIQFLNLVLKKEIETRMMEFISLINTPIVDFNMFEQRVDAILLYVFFSENFQKMVIVLVTPSSPSPLSFPFSSENFRFFLHFLLCSSPSSSSPSSPPIHYFFQANRQKFPPSVRQMLQSPSKKERCIVTIAV